MPAGGDPAAGSSSAHGLAGSLGATGVVKGRLTRRRPGDLGLALIAAFACGVILAVQSRINGELGTYLPAMTAAWSNFLIGLAAVSLLWLTPTFRGGVRAVWRAVREGGLPAWQLFGGCVGGLLVAVQTYAVPRVGVATFLIAIVGGQTVNALLVDRLRLGPAAPQLITPARLAAAALAVVGVVVAVLPGVGEGLLWLPVAGAFLVGMGTAVQQATNARITQVAGHSTVTALINFGTGFALLVLIGSWVVLPQGWPDLTGIPWWTWTGGVLGVLFIVLAAWAVMHSGVLLFALITITSQLGTGLILDLIEPSTRDRVGVQMLLGVGLTVVAAAWAAFARARSRRRGAPTARQGGHPPGHTTLLD